MKANRIAWISLCLMMEVVASFHLNAQQIQADRRLLQEIKSKAEGGEADFQLELGGVYFFGLLGVKKDDLEALKWYGKAADQSSATAQYILGVFYFNGFGVAKDDSEAAKWYRISANQENCWAQYNLAICYATGQGVVRDEAEAVSWYRKAASQKLPQAEYNIGVAYANGVGVTRNVEEAVRWYRRSAEQGLAQAQHNLGICYYTGTGVAKDAVAATKWFRKAADQNYADAQYNMGVAYNDGDGIAKNLVEAVKWYRKAADQNHAGAQLNLGHCFALGEGVTKDAAQALGWFRKAAGMGNAQGQYNLGVCYFQGFGVAKDPSEGTKWHRKASEQNYADAQYSLGVAYYRGEGVQKDYVEALRWIVLSAAQGNKRAKDFAVRLEGLMTPKQVLDSRNLASEFGPRTTSELPKAAMLSFEVADLRPKASGTGFCISSDGFLVTSEHLVKNVARVRLLMGAGLIPAKVVKVDKVNDVALLKAEGKFSALPMTPSRGVRLGSTVATVGFPNIGLQGFAPKLAKGEIASLSGAADDTRYFQISVPVQPGNSGGALVDERGNVVGVVSAKLSAQAALAASGSFPENVNYAVKSSYLLSFLESVPEVSAKLKEANTKEIKFEDVVKEAEQAAVLVLVY